MKKNRFVINVLFKGMREKLEIKNCLSDVPKIVEEAFNVFVNNMNPQKKAYLDAIISATPYLVSLYLKQIEAEIKDSQGFSEMDKEEYHRFKADIDMFMLNLIAGINHSQKIGKNIIPLVVSQLKIEMPEFLVMKDDPKKKTVEFKRGTLCQREEHDPLDEYMEEDDRYDGRDIEWN